MDKIKLQDDQKIWSNCILIRIEGRDISQIIFIELMIICYIFIIFEWQQRRRKPKKLKEHLFKEVEEQIAE